MALKLALIALLVACCIQEYYARPDPGKTQIKSNKSPAPATSDNQSAQKKGPWARVKKFFSNLKTRAKKAAQTVKDGAKRLQNMVKDFANGRAKSIAKGVKVEDMMAKLTEIVKSVETNVNSFQTTLKDLVTAEEKAQQAPAGIAPASATEPGEEQTPNALAERLIKVLQEIADRMSKAAGFEGEKGQCVAREIGKVPINAAVDGGQCVKDLVTKAVNITKENIESVREGNNIVDGVRGIYNNCIKNKTDKCKEDLAQTLINAAKLGGTVSGKLLAASGFILSLTENVTACGAKFAETAIDGATKLIDKIPENCFGSKAPASG